MPIDPEFGEEVEFDGMPVCSGPLPEPEIISEIQERGWEDIPLPLDA